MSWLQSLARPEIAALQPYEPGDWEPGIARLHANELPWRAGGDASAAGLNHYPEPQPRQLVRQLAQIYAVPAGSLLLTRGSDEAIDLLVRAFCRPGADAILVCPPTFGMYALAARIQGAQIVSVPLRAPQFTLDTGAVVAACAEPVKLVFLCSPNNPTGNLLDAESILGVIRALRDRALVVVDEAYIEFAQRASLCARLSEFPQLVVLRTLSKAYGLAGARLGALIGSAELVALLRRLIAPYAIPQLALEAAEAALTAVHLQNMPQRLAALRREREWLRAALAPLPAVRRVHASVANFLLVRCADAAQALRQARAARLLVRDARGFEGLADAVRVTVGTRTENEALIGAWR